MPKILNKEQIMILNYFGHNEFLRTNFYFTGGTALAEFYLHHRLSEDLDFFSDDIYPKEIMLAAVNDLKKELKVKKIKYLENKNRQQFLLQFSRNKNIKIEFVYFPFGKVKSKKIDKKYNIRVDSIKSIAENKIFALYESAEPKHAFDLYWIVNKYKDLNLKKLHKLAERKFGVEIDKVIFLEKALEAIDKMAKIRPMIFKYFYISPKKLVDFYKKIK